MVKVVLVCVARLDDQLVIRPSEVDEFQHFIFRFGVLHDENIFWLDVVVHESVLPHQQHKPDAEPEDVDDIVLREFYL